VRESREGLLLLVGRDVCRDKEYAMESKSLTGSLSQGDVAAVNGIESAAEES
jgi:hypothetical protein